MLAALNLRAILCSKGLGCWWWNVVHKGNVTKIKLSTTSGKHKNRHIKCYTQLFGVILCTQEKCYSRESKYIWVQKLKQINMSIECYPKMTGSLDRYWCRTKFKFKFQELNLNLNFVSYFWRLNPPFLNPPSVRPGSFRYSPSVSEVRNLVFSFPDWS